MKSGADLPILRANHYERFEVQTRVEVQTRALARLPQGVQLYSTDDHGHRTNRPVDYDRKAAETLRIAAFGASTTEGVLLDDRKTWPSQLAELLEAALRRPVEVINTAVSGTRVIHHLAAFRQSESYRPDIAIFMFGINDWNRGIVRANDTLGAFLEDVEDWRFYESVLWKAGRAAARAVGRWLSDTRRSDEIGSPGEWYAAMMSAAARRPTIHYRPRKVAPEYAAAVRGIVAECRRRAIPCLFLDQPTSYTPQFEAERRLWMNPPFGDFSVDTADLRATAALYNDWLAMIVGRTSPSFCAIADKLPASTEIFFDDCHFTEEGALVVARLVSDCLLAGSLARSTSSR